MCSPHLAPGSSNRLLQIGPMFCFCFLLFSGHRTCRIKNLRDFQIKHCFRAWWTTYSASFLRVNLGSALQLALEACPHATCTASASVSHCTPRPYSPQVKHVTGVVRFPTVDASPGVEFAGSAVEAVKKWSFEPAKLNGQPVAVLINVTMDFRLR